MKGVLILALNKQSYACAAFNLALSIKHFNPDLHITLISDNNHHHCFKTEHYSPFNFIAEIDKDDSLNEGKFCPAKAKLSLYKYSTYSETLYIDADSICFKNLDSLFEKLNGNKFKSNVVNDYTQWTDSDKFKDFFGVQQGQAINSSWIYFEKQGEEIFKTAQKYYDQKFPIEKLKQKWGNSLPDELFFNGALEKLKIYSEVHYPVMFFDDRKDERSTSKLQEDFYFMTFYGNDNSTRLHFREWYDKYMFNICTKYGIAHSFKMGNIIANKHVLTK